MKLLIYKPKLDAFKRKASKSYSREVYAIMLGTKLAGKVLRIERIIQPKLVESTYEYCIPDYNDCARIIKDSGLEYIGSIHSHPQSAPTLSEHDHRYWDNKDSIIGILSIRKRNVKKSMELKFWRKGKAYPVKFRVFTNE